MIEYNPIMSFHPFHIIPDGYVYKEGKVQPYILLQYTGLKDKNGKEIYEGDIVTWGFGAAVVSMGTILIDDQCSEGTGWIAENCFVDTECEIIGNIYEKPDYEKINDVL